MAIDLAALAAALASGELAALNEWDDARLRRAWSASVDARELLSLYGFAGDRPGLTRAACACVRVALRFPETVGELRPTRAVELAEAWARGEVSLEEVARAAMSAADADSHHVNLTYGIAIAARAAAMAAWIPGGLEADIGSPEVGATPSHPNTSIAHLASDAACLAAEAYAHMTVGATSWDETVEAQRAELAKVTRAIVPCPTVEQLAPR
jgi:hypothetical protein